MKTLQEQFVPYNIAVKLKELGFNEECLATIDQTEYLHIKGTKNNPRASMMYDIIKAPLWSQVFDWFEEKHKLYSICEYVILDFGVTDCRNQDMKIIKTISHQSTFRTKLEVKTACLKKLIEIVDNEKS